MDLEKVKEQADKVKANSERQIANIRATPHLTDQGRKNLIAKEVKACSDQLEKLRLEVAESSAAERAAIERRLWANVRPEDVTGYRDALARAASLKDADEARSLFERASLSGDQQLSRAIALDRRWSNVTEDYRRQDPEWGQAAQALIDHDRTTGSARNKMVLSMLTSAPTPPELSGASTYEVTRLAALADAG